MKDEGIKFIKTLYIDVFQPEHYRKLLDLNLGKTFISELDKTIISNLVSLENYSINNCRIKDKTKVYEESEIVPLNHIIDDWVKGKLLESNLYKASDKWVSKDRKTVVLNEEILSNLTSILITYCIEDYMLGQPESLEESIKAIERELEKLIKTLDTNREIIALLYI